MSADQNPYELGIEAVCLYSADASTPTMPEATSIFPVRNLKLSKSTDTTDATDRKVGRVKIADGLTVLARANVATFTSFELTGDMIANPHDPQIKKFGLWSVAAKVFKVAFMDSVGDGWLLPVFFSEFEDDQQFDELVIPTFTLQKGYRAWGLRQITAGEVVEPGA